MDIPTTPVLDRGYVKVVDFWGSDVSIIEAARMSTGKGFKGWEDRQVCSFAGEAHVYDHIASPFDCGVCGAKAHTVKGDASLLKYLYTHKHMTPFEMCGLVIEVKAPIFVFREWHRHRTQSYNEMSARYIPLPDENYVPDLENLIDRAIAAKEAGNKQARGASDAKGSPIEPDDLAKWIEGLETIYGLAQMSYENGLKLGVPKELARLPVPVARYSVMRASANLRNWLAFLTLRMDPAAQWEIRQYAEAVGNEISTYFPKTWELFTKEKEL